MEKRRDLMKPQSGGFTLVELLVVIAIIGILMGLLLPGVQRVRGAARAVQCRNNLKQIALATEMFHGTYNCYPPGRYKPRPGEPAPHDCGGEETTWFVRILPFMEQEDAEDRWDYQESYYDHPDPVRESNFPQFVCPSRRPLSRSIGRGIQSSTGSWLRLPCGCRIFVPNPTSITVTGAVGDYGGNYGDMSPGTVGLATDLYYGGNGTGVIVSSRAQCEGTSPIDWIDRITHESVTDGLSSTFLAGEAHVPQDGIGEAPNDAFIFNGDSVFNFARVGGPTVPIVSDIREKGNALVSWGSYHRSACNFALCDGSVKSIMSTMDTELLGNLCNRADGEAISLLD